MVKGEDSRPAVLCDIPEQVSSATHGWIRLQRLAVDGVRLGIYPHERDNPRTVVVDVGLWVPTAVAARSELISDTIDYDGVAAAVREVSRARHYPLLEALCETLATTLLERFEIDRVAVEVAKPDALAPGTVSIAIERSR